MNRNCARRRLAAVLFLSLASIPGLWAQSPTMVDLTALESFVRPGFALEWTYAEPKRDDPAWTRIAPHQGDRPMVLRDLPIATRQQRGRFAVGSYKPEKFTAVFVFEAHPALLDSSSGVGLYLKDIGKNWEIYLNGSVIASEVYLSRTGEIVRERAVHGALVDIDKRFLMPGRNVLTMVMMGDANEGRTGLFSGGPHLVGDYRNLLKLKSEYLDLMLIGIYFFFALYHLILFALRPANRPYLFYGLGTLSFAVYLFATSFIVFDLISDTAVIRGIELSSLFIFFPLFLGFFDTANRGRLSLFTWIYGGISLVLFFVAPILWGEVLFELWQKSLPVPILYLLVFDCILPTSRNLRELGSVPPRERLAAFTKRTEFWTIAIGYIIVLFLLVAGVLSLASLASFASAKIGAFFLIFGTATVLARQFTGLYRDVEGLNQGLEQRVSERTSALAGVMEEQSGLNANLQAANLKLRNAMDLAAKDMRIAVQVQQGIFPQKAPENLDWELSFVYRPVNDVSGDFYDFYVEGNRLIGASVGDVSGHGISSGLITVLARSIFYRAFRNLSTYSLGRIVEEINGELSSELSTVENYLTASLLRLDGCTVEYANAANTDLAFRRAGKAKANYVKPEAPGGFKGPPLGREGIEASYRSVKFAVEPGDSLLIYTDCLKNAVDDSGKPFSADGLLSAYGMAPSDSAADMLEYIIEEWKFHVGETPVTDDLTAVLLRKK